MDRRRHPIPTSLGNVFTAGAARAAGVDSRRLHGDDVVRIAPGTYARVDGEVAAVPASHGSGRQPHPHERWRQSIALRATKLSEVMKPNAFFSHHTAAVLWGSPSPRHWATPNFALMLARAREAGLTNSVASSTGRCRPGRSEWSYSEASP